MNGLIEINFGEEIDRPKVNQRGAGSINVAVVTGHSRSKNGVATLAYVPVTSIRDVLPPISEMAGTKPGHDNFRVLRLNHFAGGVLPGSLTASKVWNSTL